MALCDCPAECLQTALCDCPAGCLQTQAVCRPEPPTAPPRHWPRRGEPPTPAIAAPWQSTAAAYDTLRWQIHIVYFLFEAT